MPFSDSANIIIDRCRVHNDASCDISLDGRFIATLLPKESTFPTEIYLLIFSLMPDTLGRCLIKKAFGNRIMRIEFIQIDSLKDVFNSWLEL